MLLGVLAPRRRTGVGLLWHDNPFVTRSSENRSVSSELVTARLRLRPWTNEDYEPLVELFAKPEFWWYPMRRGLTRPETALYLIRRLAEQNRGELVDWVAEDRATGRLIGHIGFGVPDAVPEILPCVEIGWRIGPDYWGRGLATEGARAALQRGFTRLGLTEVVAICEPENVASVRVAEKLGMRFDCQAKDCADGFPLLIYRLSESEWRSGQTERRD